MATKRDYYEVLGLRKDSGTDDIKKAYRQMALKNHPDRNPGDAEAEARFKEAAEAYSILSDSDKRQRYDAYGHAGVSGPAGAGGFDPSTFTDFSDILGDFFGLGDPGRRRGGGARRGADLRYTIEIDFEEGLFGATKTIRVPRHEKCATCSGSGAAAGSKPTTCGTCNGTGQIAFQQGFFTVARTCGRCRGSGKIINIASLLTFFGGITVPGYAASKGAVGQLTKALSNEWAGRGVNVNAIAPGYMVTDNTAPLRADAARSKEVLSRIPANRWGEPGDLEGAAIFLASSASDYLSCHIMAVDGGWCGR